MRSSTATTCRDRINNHDDQWKTVALSFAAGAASVSLVWFAKERRRRRRHDHNDNDNGGQQQRDNSQEEEHRQSSRQPTLSLQHSSSFMDTVKQSWQQSVEDIRSRIGELPSRVKGQRGHWPWETMHRKANNNPSNDAINITGDISPKSASSATKNEEKSELCIGSIFGLDVGGTLAKLVYFEQRPDYDMEHQLNLRERQYHRAASAQAVLKARRGNQFPHYHRPRSSMGADPTRERSFSVGLLRRRFSAGEAEIDQLVEELEEKAQECKETRKEYHTAESNDDIQDMYLMRQESVPDDLNAFASSLHIEPKEKGKAPSSKGNTYQTCLKDASTDSSSSGMKKSRSMFDLSISQKSKDHAEALDRFYHFARRLDSYREGVKDHKLSFYSRALGGEFHFIRYETRRMENAMELIRANDLHLTIREMGATGGGAHKYAADWDRILGIQMDKQDELDSLVAGMQFVLSTVVGECYTFRPHTKKNNRSNEGTERSTNNATQNATVADDEVNTKPISPLTSKVRSSNSLNLEEEKKSPTPTPVPSEISSGSSDESDSERLEPEKDNRGADEWWWSRKVQRDAISYSKTYPYLVVSIGTGVSILRVDGPRVYERISGSTIGGGTYWGLIRLLTDLEDFEDVMRLAEHGDPSKVDMMVGDIYGNNSDALEKLGLPASLVASSFGKLVAKENPAAGLKQEDLARALLLMVTNNIGQVAYLNAQLHKTPRIYFVGNFLRGNKLSQRRLSFAIDFWSKGEMEALFLEHEGYFGALGAFLLSQDISLDDLEPPRKQEVKKGIDPKLSRHDSDCADEFVIRNHYQHRRSQTMEENMFTA